MMRVTMQRQPFGARATVHVGDIHIGADSTDPVSALHAASGLARDLVELLDKHPEAKRLLPPQALIALEALQIASWAAKNGKLDEVQKKMPAPVRKIVVKLLRSINQ